MKEKFVLVLTLVLIAATHVSCVPEEEGFVSMFNGKDLTEWDGKPGGWWVEDGAITSQSTEEEPCLKHHYLFWEGGEPSDFILRFKYRIAGGNSGLQFRSEKRDNYDTWGYQADIEAGPQWTGCLFQHGRKGVVMRGYRATISEDGQREEEEFASPDELMKLVRTDDWNDYEVVAKGSQVILRINGKLMCQVDDRNENACRDGFIALQMHPGPPMKIQFKDMYIKVLDKSP